MSFLQSLFVTDAANPSRILIVNADGSINVTLSGNIAQETGGNLAAIAGKDFATQTTLAALNAKVTAVNTGAVVLAAGAAAIGTVGITGTVPLPTNAAIETGGNLATIAAKDFATQTTLAALNTKVTAVNTGAVVLAAGAANIGNIVNISGTISLPTGAATAAKQPALGTAGASSSDVLSIQGISGGTPIPISGSITATNPSVGVDGSAFPTSSTQVGFQSGANLVAVSASNPLPITGSISATNPSVSTTATTAPTSATEVGGVYNSSPPTFTTGQLAAIQVDVNGNQKVAVVGTVAISAASLPLPTGAATSAKQPAIGAAGSASTDVITVQGIASMTALKVDGSAVTQPISAASLPLPTGASTSALQTTGNTSLNNIDTKTPALGQQLAAASSPVVLTAIQVAALTPPTTQASNITQVGGTSITLGQKTASASFPVTLASDNGITQAAVSPGTTSAPSAAIAIVGKTSDATPTYNVIPLIAGGLALSMAPLGLARTDASGSVGVLAATALALNAARRVLEFQNVSTTATLYFTTDGTTAVAGAAGTYTLLPGQGYNPAFPPTGAISVIASAASTPYTLKWA